MMLVYMLESFMGLEFLFLRFFLFCWESKLHVLLSENSWMKGLNVIKWFFCSMMSVSRVFLAKYHVPFLNHMKGFPFFKIIVCFAIFLNTYDFFNENTLISNTYYFKKNYGVICKNL